MLQERFADLPRDFDTLKLHFMYKFEHWPSSVAGASYTSTSENERTHKDVKPAAGFTNNRKDAAMAQVQPQHVLGVPSF